MAVQSTPLAMQTDHAQTRIVGSRRFDGIQCLTRIGERGSSVLVEVILLVLLVLFTGAVLSVATLGAWSILRKRFNAPDQEPTDRG